MMTPLELLRRMTDMDVPQDNAVALSSAQRSEILAALLEWEAADGLKISQMARILGCSPSVYSQIRQGKYAGSTDRYLRSAAKVLAERAQRSVIPDSEWVATADGVNIHRVCLRAWRMPCMAKVILDSGSGKTAALVEFARTQGDRVRYLQAGEACSSKVGFVAELARVMRVPILSRQSMTWIYFAVRDKLAAFYQEGKASPILLIVDEATTLHPGCLNILRNLHDDPNCRLAVVLADTRRLDVELSARSGIAGGFEQLRSRFGAVYAPAPDRRTSDKDVRAVAHSLLASLGVQMTLNADAIKYLTRLANEPGRLRNVTYRLQTVHDLADAAGISPCYSVAELDYVAELVGARSDMVHQHVPFGNSRKQTAAVERAAADMRHLSQTAGAA